ncbi:1,4-dihydroxy-2-naphthoate octaprenyltransferase [Ruminiclostridium hungatei]|uniref:1,4-dihydroxy-2-naphthoate octaprenyltransferase n=1 Tax=Ruminiclostridium hungatei TaxID=48256 RepID=A0A1V4SKJ8_RUMHU|nr:UbiA family prenyltransferase [Ruminiclostridium hungatei]OPX44418.1 1,4-dihydroxy-2-naphthoate octaprenyltransferase [Ruminiclostridium hungatei]
MVLKLLNYTEIKTKITSIFAFLMTIAYIYSLNKPINWRLTLIFFVSMFVFDLTTTAINNYIDTKTNHQTLDFKRGTALMIIYVLFLISAGFGLYLAYLTDVVVLLLGAVCFICGVFYTFGPVPISRQPLGEIFSGLFYGLLIPFLLLYINMPEGTYLTLKLGLDLVSLEMKVIPLITVILLSIAPICTTANIMLANNICDVDKDISVMRYTLPYYLGNKPALYLFAALYYMPYAAIIAMVAGGMLSPICLTALVTLIFVQKNINTFFKLQDKEKTFICSIKNYVIIMASITLVIFISGLL